MSEVKQLTHSLAPETVYEVDLPLFRLQGTLPVLTVSAAGTCSELVPPEVDLSVVVEFVGTAVFAVEIVIAAAVAPGPDEIDGPNRSVMMQGTSAESFGSW